MIFESADWYRGCVCCIRKLVVLKCLCGVVLLWESNVNLLSKPAGKADLHNDVSWLCGFGVVLEGYS